MTKIRTFCERHEITDGRLYDCPVCLREERDAAKAEVEWLRNENVTALKRAEDAESNIDEVEDALDVSHVLERMMPQELADLRAEVERLRKRAERAERAVAEAKMCCDSYPTGDSWGYSCPICKGDSPASDGYGCDQGLPDDIQHTPDCLYAELREKGK